LVGTLADFVLGNGMEQTQTHEPLSRSAPGGPGSALKVVARSAPARPRWGVVYGLLLVVLVSALTGHALVPAGATRLVDAVFILAACAVLFGWVQRNRVALARLEEPDAGAGRPLVRTVRSRVPPEPPRETGTIDGGDCDEHVVLPHDSR
jgi:hypothetical protein